MKNFFKSILIFVSTLMFISISSAQVPANVKKIADACIKGPTDNLDSCFNKLLAPINNLEIEKYKELIKRSSQDDYSKYSKEQYDYIEHISSMNFENCTQNKDICKYKYFEARMNTLGNQLNQLSVPVVKVVEVPNDLKIEINKCMKKYKMDSESCINSINTELHKTIYIKYVELANYQPTAELQNAVMVSHSVYANRIARNSLGNQTECFNDNVTIPSSICVNNISRERLAALEAGIKDSKAKGYKLNQ